MNLIATLKKGQKEYRLYLVTNKHVFKDKKSMVVKG